jgi:two-component system nitrate/nitrite sensor histidine kinase NarX
MRLFWNALSRRSIMIGIALGMVAITAIGVGGIATSVIVAEGIQGSGSAINVAGSLRWRSHRMGSLVLADTLNRTENHGNLLLDINQYEARLADPALRGAMARAPDSDYARTFRSVLDTWHNRLKPLLLQQAMAETGRGSLEQHNALLQLIDDFVDEINTMVAQLEADAEARITLMRGILGSALFLITIVLFVSMYLVHKSVLAPLGQLLENAASLARGEFSARIRDPGEDELGQLGRAFNTMAEELSKLYRGLELRVAEKTAALTCSNQSLELLYNAISRLHNAPLAPETYQAMLKEIEAVLGLKGSLACLMPKHDGNATLLASTLGSCLDQNRGDCAGCMASLAQVDRWRQHREGDDEILSVPLRDHDGIYGVLRLMLRPGQRLEPWQEQLMEALSRHIGIALGISRRTEQERLLALQEERSVIARELHDSIAQSLTYMKIQASLLQPVLADPVRREEAETTLCDLREGITSAYRQLRELLATFRLKMEGDFLDLLQRTVTEFSDRGGLEIALETRLEGCHLTPNQEIHALQIIREALYNVLRHAEARHAWIQVHFADGEVQVVVADDGVGLPVPDPATADRSPASGYPHYGLNIMSERAQSLGGRVTLEARPGGGTRVRLRFPAHARAPINLVRVETPFILSAPTP